MALSIQKAIWLRAVGPPFLQDGKPMGDAEEFCQGNLAKGIVGVHNALTAQCQQIYILRVYV